MAQRRVVWTNTASTQFRKVLEFWVEHNQSSTYSLKLLDKVEKHLNGILKHPERSPESTFPNTRAAAMNHYSVFYKIADDQIIVTAFWDNRQDPKRLIEMLKNSS